MTSIYIEGQAKQPPLVLHGPSLSSPPEIGRTKPPGAHIMGPPADPKVHVDHQKAATWTAADHHSSFRQNPYIQYSTVDQKPADKPQNNFVNVLNQWSKIADTTSRNIWHNLKLGPSVSEAACGKINLTAKALNEGGFEPLFKQSFDINRNEKLKKWFACYLSTTMGPVSGTLYLSTAHVAFCSDRPLLCKSPSGLETYSYYKIMIPLASIGKVNSVIVRETPPDKYIHIVTVDGHHFWFIGFVSFERATHYLFKNAPHTSHAYNSSN